MFLILEIVNIFINYIAYILQNSEYIVQNVLHYYIIGN